MQLAPLICVRDVEASSLWYQRLLGCESGHGGSHYERLNANGRLILQLHRWDVEHHHGRLGDPDIAHGNGVVLWFELERLRCGRAARREHARRDRQAERVLRERQLGALASRSGWLQRCADESVARVAVISRRRRII